MWGLVDRGKDFVFSLKCSKKEVRCSWRAFFFFSFCKCLYFTKFHLKMCSSVDIVTFSLLCSHHHFLFSNVCHHPKWKICDHPLPSAALVTSLRSFSKSVCSWNLRQVESHDIWPLGSGLFHLASCFQGSSVL